MISQSKAATLAGVSREEFLLGGGRFQVSAVLATHEELPRNSHVTEYWIIDASPLILHAEMLAAGLFVSRALVEQVALAAGE